MTSKSRPESITGGCLCGSIRYTIHFPADAEWPPSHVSPDSIRSLNIPAPSYSDASSLFLCPRHVTPSTYCCLTSHCHFSPTTRKHLSPPRAPTSICAITNHPRAIHPNLPPSSPSDHSHTQPTTRIPSQPPPLSLSLSNSPERDLPMHPMPQNHRLPPRPAPRSPLRPSLPQPHPFLRRHSPARLPPLPVLAGHPPRLLQRLRFQPDVDDARRTPRGHRGARGDAG